MAACSGDTEEQETAPAQQPETSSSDGPQLAEVVVIDSTLRPLTNVLELRGTTAPDRFVEVKAQTDGAVVTYPIRQGTDVVKGQLLCQLDQAEREATLTEAQANLDEAQVTASGSAQLARKGYATNNRVMADQAQLKSARARLEQVELDIERTNIRAPFDGRLETDTAEQGALLQRGNICATIVDFDPIHIVVYPSEKEIDAVIMGAPVDVTLASGQTFQADVSFISKVADENTRTFKVEATATNTDGIIRAGTTATVRIGLADTKAHFAPQSALVLNDAGVLGVRVVDPDNTVQFRPVRTLRDNDQGVFIQSASDTPLRAQEKIVVVGQNYINEGQTVQTKVMQP